jgi:arylsulfatase A-like enzyme
MFPSTRSMGTSKENWPLGLGYDRFYGFLGGETNQWYPELIEDNHFVEQPSQPEDGHTSPRTLLTRRSSSSATRSKRRPTSRGTSEESGHSRTR